MLTDRTTIKSWNESLVINIPDIIYLHFDILIFFIVLYSFNFTFVINNFLGVRNQIINNLLLEYLAKRDRKRNFMWPSIQRGECLGFSTDFRFMVYVWKLSGIFFQFRNDFFTRKPNFFGTLFHKFRNLGPGNSGLQKNRSEIFWEKVQEKC